MPTHAAAASVFVFHRYERLDPVVPVLAGHGSSGLGGPSPRQEKAAGTVGPRSPGLHTGRSLLAAGPLLTVSTAVAPRAGREGPRAAEQRECCGD